MSKKIMLLIILLILSLGTNVFLFLKINEFKITGNYQGSFHLIKPLKNEPIDSNTEDTKSVLHYKKLKETLEQEVDNYNARGKIGVFVQDVETGAWLGINEKESFAPSSLLKIPIMMAILKKVEHGEIKLNDKIILIQEDMDEQYGDLYKEGAGSQFTVSELLKYMIKFSDNTAKNALKRQLSMSEINSVFTHLGISNPYLVGNNQTVSPRGYIRIFKSLYYSTFLSPELSERALDLTTDTNEENLIPKGIPPEIQVAHKFGISGNIFLHDCGIIYHQKNPYFLCIMTKDLGFSQSTELIPKISKDIYEFVTDLSD